MSREPAKYLRNDKGNWVFTPEWKIWSKEQRKKSAPASTNSKRAKVTAENHHTTWKEVAYVPTGKAIYFCVCMSVQGDPYKGCGAVGIKRSRNAIIAEVIGSRFE